MRYADRGTMIQGGESQGQAIVQLSQIDPMRLVLPIPESVAPEITVGRVVQVEVPTLLQTFQSHVTRLSGTVDAETRTMDTEVDVPNADMLLKPGMHARVALVVAGRPSALTVPVQAVSRAGGKTSVMIVNAKQRIELREVVIGIETPSDVEIESGLADSDLVVIGSHSLLEPGQLVTPRETQPVDASEDF
jgi:RND family efflux transporter MFP subunit